MAEIKSKQSTERTKLETVIPLKTPYVLMLGIASACNFKCIYCPCSAQELLKEHNVKKGIMPYDLFTKIIDDLDDFPDKLKVLRLVKEGEPLLNKRFADMVRYAKKKQPSVEIDTTTNASLLTPELSDSIIEAGLDKIFISLQGINAKSYKKLSGVDIDFDKLLENIYYFCKKRGRCKVYIKVPDISVNEVEKEMFFKMFSAHADEMFIEHIIPTWPGFDLSSVKKDDGIGYYGQPVHSGYIKVCPIMFYDMTVDPDGSVPPCQLDWLHKTPLGNVNNESLFQIWNGARFNELRKFHLRGNRSKHPFCGKCQALEYCNVDNIDPFADELLERFKSLP